MTFTELLYDTRRLVLGDGTSTVYSTTDITYSINRALEHISSVIREAQGRWQWDDTNQTDFPIATTGLVTDQQDYSLDGTSHFRIERVEVKDSAGAWTKLLPIDQADVYNQSLTDLLKTSGRPQYYDKEGNSLILYPKPSYTQTASLKLYFERGPSYFSTSDTSKTPGFNPLYHRLLSLYAAHDYAFLNVMKDLDKNLIGEIAVMESALTTSYALRDMDDRTQLKTRQYNYR